MDCTAEPSSTMWYDHPSCSELKFSTPHNTIYLDHRPFLLTAEKRKKKGKPGCPAHELRDVFLKRRCQLTPSPAAQLASIGILCFLKPRRQHNWCRTTTALAAAFCIQWYTQSPISVDSRRTCSITDSPYLSTAASMNSATNASYSVPVSCRRSAEK